MAPLLYLASSSPRRRALLAAAKLAFVAVPPGPEIAGAGSPDDEARSRARSKACGADLGAVGPSGLVLGVDTVVAVDGRELGKPVGRRDAEAMLRALAGRVHEVHTAQCLVDRGSGARDERIATARVRVAPLDDAAVARYLATGEWSDKAGGYGIQGAAGAFCELIGGDRDTVVGLSIATLREQIAALCPELGGPLS